MKVPRAWTGTWQEICTYINTMVKSYITLIVYTPYTPHIDLRSFSKLFIFHPSFELRVYLDDSIASQLALEVPCFHCMGSRIKGAYLCPADICVGAEELNPGPHACTAGDFPTEPSAQLFNNFWFLSISTAEIRG